MISGRTCCNTHRLVENRAIQIYICLSSRGVRLPLPVPTDTHQYLKANGACVRKPVQFWMEMTHPFLRNEYSTRQRP